MPSTWTFEGSNDGATWTIFDEKSDYIFSEGANEFSLTNNKQYKNYRINISKNNGASGKHVNLSIHEMEMWGYELTDQVPEPAPDPTPVPEPSEPSEPGQPAGSRELLVVTMEQVWRKSMISV
ncbi:UNVERIFIED_CONTAM: hypothetical protein ABIC26_002551 [Paenibacillus sp. PvR008]